MCNINSLLIPGASEIDRFEHSIGVLRLAEEWLAAHPLPSDKARNLRAAAILHDILTPPFGHSLQYILEDNEVAGHFSHQGVSRGVGLSYYQKLSSAAAFEGFPFRCHTELGSAFEPVSRIIEGLGELGPLVSGTLDLDNLDNVVRLAFHAGIATEEDKRLPIELARRIRPVNRDLVVTRDAVSLIQRWQWLRQSLYEFLLLDWAEFAAKAMLTRAIEEAVENEILGTDSWTLSDAELMSQLTSRSVGAGQQIAELVRRIRVGALYEPISLCKTDAIGKYRELSTIRTKRILEHKIKRAVKDVAKSNVKVLLHPILDSRKTRRAIEVIVEGTKGRQIVGQDSNCMLVGVFVSGDLPGQRSIEDVQSRVRQILHSAGIENLEPWSDPMGEERREYDNQLRLF